MNTNVVLPVVILILGILFNGWLVNSLFTRPERFWRFFDRRFSWPYKRGEPIDEGFVSCYPFIGLLFCSCILCFLIYKWLQVFVER